MKCSIVISTGGTGGHIIPAVTMAEYFLDKGYNVTVVGDKKTENYIKNSKIAFYEIKSGYTLKKINSLLSIFKGFLSSLKIIRETKPDVVIGFGCYTTLPILLASKIKKIPIFLHEGNAFIGKINRFFLKDCVNIFTSFQEIYGIDVKQSDKILFTGSVVRKDVIKYYNDTYKSKKENDVIKILITGGSGGASFFSTEFIKVFQHMNKNMRNRLYIYHQVKTKEELDSVKLFYNKENIKSEVKLFFDDLPQKMFDSDLVVCRCGIGTLSELSVIGRASIMVPSPNVANDHQLYNAKFFERSGACVIVEEKSFVAQNFATTIENIINNKLEMLANNIKSMAVINADSVIFDTIDEFINNNKKMKEL